jgi:hypothetical protein
MEHFDKLYEINVNNHTEEKNGLTYLSWAWAWQEVKEVYPDATYTIKKFENSLPYVYDEKVGYMVFTEVTIEGLTHEMWLPVMDGANKAMKSEPYTYKTKYGEKTVEAATMFDINKTIMRCLVKNLAMFGLGLYIYAGEDLPQVEEKKIDKELATALVNTLKAEGFSDEDIGKSLAKYKVKTAEELTESQYAEILLKINKK